MHSYYAENKEKLKKALSRFMQLVKLELEKAGGKPYPALLAEIWDYYEKNLLERFPYIGGDKVSGTKNLTGAYCFVAMGEVLKRYGVSMEEIGRIIRHQIVNDTRGFGIRQGRNDILLIINLQQRENICSHVFRKQTEHLERILIFHAVHDCGDVRFLHILQALAQGCVLF